MKELLKTMARALVDNEDEVSVEQVELPGTIVLELKVAKDDIGKVIGKKGNIATALRTILSSHAAKMNKRVVMEISE